MKDHPFIVTIPGRDVSYLPGFGSGPAEQKGALAMGGASAVAHGGLASRFGTLVLCAREYQPRAREASPSFTVLRARLDDSGPPPSPEELKEALRAAAEVTARLRAGRRVLVTCYAGLNRSGLVTGLALLGLGYTAPEAIEKIRAARGPLALSNPHFVRVLKIYDRQRYSPRSLAEQLQAEM